MTPRLIADLTTLLCLLPLTVIAFRPVTSGRTWLFWLALCLAAAGTAARAGIQILPGWPIGLGAALWMTIANCLILYAGLCLTTASAWRLARLLLPYLLILASFAAAAPVSPLISSPLAIPQVWPGIGPGIGPGIWVNIHIGLSVLTYALVTLAAVAALAGMLQEHAIKAKQVNSLTRALPPVSESEALQVRLLVLAEIILGVGLLTGITALHYARGAYLRLDHKSLLSLCAFIVIGILLFAHVRSGIRGRSATRLVLTAYLLLTLAYIGVKFVREVLLTGAVL